MSATVRAWLLAIRPATLTAAIVPVVVGSAVAARDAAFHAPAALAALAGAMLIQIGTNLVNDVDDFERGADTEDRRGPTRVTQGGLLPATRVLAAGWAAFAGAALVGCYLVLRGGWPILVAGLAAIACGRAYTGGPWPLGYRGLGDLFVFLFFGVVAVVGTYYVQTLHVTGTAWAASVPVGALATAILVVNNVRDVQTDRHAGKRTLVVRFGESFGRAQYAVLVAAAYAVPALLWLSGGSARVMLPWLSLPLAWTLVRDMKTQTHGPALNDALAATARLQLVFGVLFAAGLGLGG